MAYESIALEDVTLMINGNIVGGAQTLEATYTQEAQPIHEGGSRMPREIRRGTVTVNGRVEKLYLDNDSIKELIDFEEGNSPEFDIVGVTKNKNPERRVTIIGAVFKGFTLTIALNDASKIPLEFEAKRIKL